MARSSEASNPNPWGRYEERIWEPSPGAPGGRRNRAAFRYEAFVPAPIGHREFSFRSDVAAELTDATTALTQLNADPPRLQSLEALARQLLRSESLASSRIEGLELSHVKLARALHSDGAVYDQKAEEVAGNVRAMERAIELGSSSERLRVEDITAIHVALMQFSLDRKIAGAIRESQNWIGKSVYSPRNADYIPPPPEYVSDLLADLCDFLARDDLPAVGQAAIAHAQFETIHPFWDGNGRVGRCLIHTVLKRRSVAPRLVPPVSVALSANRARYIGGLEDYRAGRVDDWVEVFARTVSAACAEADGLADGIDGLQREWLARADNPRAGSTARRIVERLPAHPVIDVSTVERLLGVSDVAAGNALNRLEKAGVLVSVGNRKRGRTWECRELFELVTGVEEALGA